VSLKYSCTQQSALRIYKNELVCESPHALWPRNYALFDEHHVNGQVQVSTCSYFIYVDSLVVSAVIEIRLVIAMSSGTSKFIFYMFWQTLVFDRRAWKIQLLSKTVINHNGYNDLDGNTNAYDTIGCSGFELKLHTGVIKQHRYFVIC